MDAASDEYACGQKQPGLELALAGRGHREQATGGGSDDRLDRIVGVVDRRDLVGDDLDERAAPRQAR